MRRILLTDTLTNLIKIMSVRFCFGLGREIYELDAVFNKCLCKALAKVWHRSLQPVFLIGVLIYIVTIALLFAKQ